MGVSLTDEQLDYFRDDIVDALIAIERDGLDSVIAQAREANRLREDYQRSCVENKTLLDQLRDAKDKLEVAAAKAEAATIAKVVAWIRVHADFNGRMASRSEIDGHNDRARRWSARENEAIVLADMLKSGEWAKEQQC